MFGITNDIDEFFESVTETGLEMFEEASDITGLTESEIREIAVMELGKNIASAMTGVELVIWFANFGEE